MNVVDSSGWLAYFADEPQAKHFQKQLCAPSTLVVPTISIYEVFKVVLRESTENEALQAVSAMQKGKVIALTTSLAMTASKLSITHNLPMADSVILATARAYEATLWTMDSDFKSIRGVKYFSKE
ncbi:tRNA(fMet)-specific endonuclease VapC [bacterium BMS3Abin07]|nr:tRNA(fMet)-specific endonuclease VapC [bacterium BMS3Abin07]GBE33491.1 tRNA(fMet)-specific endonuclease VapC [bacterium BMS3Bbin05]